MATLSADLSADSQVVPLSAGDIAADVTPSGLYRLDDELVWVGPELGVTGRGRETAAVGRIARRALQGTTVASHASGTTLEAIFDVTPFPSAGGSQLTADELAAIQGADPPLDSDHPPLTSPVAIADGGTGATDAAGARAALEIAEGLGATLVISNDTGVGGGTGLGIVNSPDVDLNAATTLAATATGVGNADVSSIATATGGGDAVASSVATATDSGQATAVQTANTVDNIADVSAAATATGTGGATARNTAAAASGDAHAEVTATTGVNGSAFADITATATPSGGGLGTATATLNASSEDGPSDVSQFAQASGIGTAKANSTAYGGNNAEANTSVISANGDANADREAIVNGAGNGSAFARTNANAINIGEAHVDIRSEAVDGGAYARSYAIATGTGEAYAGPNATSISGDADATASATAGVNSASFGPIANPTRAEIQCNNLPLYTQAAVAPGGSFVSLFYKDTTAVTGAPYMWDFVTGAYVKLIL